MSTTKICACLLSIAIAPMAMADAVTPEFDVFGPLPAATFGGSGIPNDAVAITTVADSGNTITIGLSAHERFVGPLADDGAGTFTAAAGVVAGLASWNFNFYIDIAGGGAFEDYQFNLRYTFDPAVGTDLADHGTLNLNAAAAGLGADLSTLTLAEDSQNLAFGYLAVDSAIITAPSGAFDADAVGQYSFVLEVWTPLGTTPTLLGTSAILVNVVPAPGAMALLGFAGLAGSRRRRRC